MTIRHHPADTTILAYAAGGLSGALAAITATHLAMCPECRTRLRAAEAMGGDLIHSGCEAQVAYDSLARVFDRIDDLADDPVNAALDAVALDNVASGDLPSDLVAHHVPAPLGRLLPADLDSLRWRTLGPGIRQAQVISDSDAVRLLRIAPGRAVPHHGHRGQEMTLILSGSYTDEIGRFQAGDIADLDPDVRHQPVSDSDVDCVCIIATDAPLAFTGIVPRLLQPFVGI